MSEITYSTAKKLVLADLRKTMLEMPVAERERPRYIINMKPYSILDLIAAIERNTPEGKKWVFDRAKYLGYVVK
ncbi:unnamed protein product [marine sediment metagenome]|uniref:Uncharacterized protein n=1 Tax=marine sediment metagenome TaxID=412755 RepID=X1KCH8_9ZZZZ